MTRGQQLLLPLLACAGAVGAVHVHLAPAAGRGGAGPSDGQLRPLPGMDEEPLGDPRDPQTLEALYCADGPVPLRLEAAAEPLSAGGSSAVRLAAAGPGSPKVAGGRNSTGAVAVAQPPAEEAPKPFASVRPGRPGGWKRVIVRMVVVLACAAVIFAIFSMYNEPIYNRTRVKVEHVCCAAYASLSISIDLSIKNAARVNGGKYPFNPACAVVTVEALKLIASVVLFGFSARSSLREGKEIVLPGLMDVAWLMVPGFVYTCNNIIVFLAIGHCPLGAFGVIRETMLIWNALLWTVVFRAPIGRMRWFSILLLFLGCVVNQLPAFFRAEFTLGVLWAFLLAFSNAAGAVANEYAMKRKAAMDINLQNCILYFFCGSFGMLYLVIFALDDLRKGFFTGFGPQCVQVVILQMLTGLAVSRILKYVDAVTKTG